MRTGAELTRRALAAALAVAAEHGVRCEEPEILRDASNLLVLLRPAPVVARVMTVTSTFRTGDAWLAREVAIASYLAAAGAPVVPPSAELDPGPHHHDGLVLSFWTYVDEAGRELDAAQAGRRLRICHDLLEHFDGALPALAAIEEAATVLDDLPAAGAVTEDDAAMLRHVGAGVREQIDASSTAPTGRCGTTGRTASSARARGISGASSAPTGCFTATRHRSPPPGRPTASRAATTPSSSRSSRPAVSRAW